MELWRRQSSSTECTTELHFPPRPGYGTQGKPVKLQATYFELITGSDSLFYRYCVEVVGDKTQISTKTSLAITIMLQEHFPGYISGIVTDYRSILICSRNLPIQPDPYVIHYTEDESSAPVQNREICRLRLKATGIFRLPDAIDYLTSARPSTLFRSKEDVIQALNIIIGHHPKSSPHVFSIGSNKHFELNSEKIPLNSGLIVVRGLFVSIRAMESRLLVNVHTTYSTCYQDGFLSQLMLAYMNNHGSDMQKLEAFLKTLRVKITHVKRLDGSGAEIQRIRNIAGFANPGDGDGLEYRPVVPKFAANSTEVKFFLKLPGHRLSTPSEEKGDYISVRDFFSSAYNISLCKTNLPVVNVGSRENPIYLPPDVCMVLPGQPCNAEVISMQQRQQMIKFAFQKPKQNILSTITTAMRVLGIPSSHNSSLTSFNLAVSPKLITVPGRVLPGPTVKYRDGKQVTTKFGNWGMRSVEFSAGTSLSNWTYLWISHGDSRDTWSGEKELKNSLKVFHHKLNQLGINANIPILPGMRITLTGTNEEAMVDEAFDRFFNSPHRPPPSFLLVILRSNRDPVYNRVKVNCDLKRGIHNVCVVGRNFAHARENDGFFTNIALKVNLKLGGRNQCVDASKLGIISQGKTMVVGIDVTHPAPGSSATEPSIAAMVASVDRWLAQWPAELSIQKGRQEMVSSLDMLLKSRLYLWAETNRGAYPENILVYRDGVSEGQYETVLKEELPLLRKACNEVYRSGRANQTRPRISIVIVGKRHHTRFFPTSEQDIDSNTLNGTVVDRDVTEGRKWDFYLQSHSVTQGIARPAHYVVILDEIFHGIKVQAPFQNPADAMEALTHNMCYLFGRCTRAVSICPPAYYADLVCRRGRCYVSGTCNVRPKLTFSGTGIREESMEHARVLENMRLHPKVRHSMFYI